MNGFGADNPSFGARLRLSLERLLTGYLDRTTLYPRTRWLVFCVLMSFFVTRVLLVQGKTVTKQKRRKNQLLLLNRFLPSPLIFRLASHLYVFFFIHLCLCFLGFFVICYALAIYLLNLFIGFLTPQVDPESEGYVLPVREAEEYRPFQRRLPEYKFWYF